MADISPSSINKRREDEIEDGISLTRANPSVFLDKPVCGPTIRTEPDATNRSKTGAVIDCCPPVSSTSSVHAKNPVERISDFCSSLYSNRVSLLHHARNKHPGMTLERLKRRNKTTSSGSSEESLLCRATFLTKSSLLWHNRTVHPSKRGLDNRC